MAMDMEYLQHQARACNASMMSHNTCMRLHRIGPGAGLVQARCATSVDKQQSDCLVDCLGQRCTTRMATVSQGSQKDCSEMVKGFKKEGQRYAEGTSMN